MLRLLPLLALAAPPHLIAAPRQDSLPELIVRADDTRVDRSCRIVIPAGLVIRDADGDGVIQVLADGVRLEFAPGSVLRGAEPETPWDVLSGCGIRVASRKGVTIAGARVHGFKVGVHATEADGLVVEDGEFSDNFRQRLRSTPEAADDGRDWLAPHYNDRNQWLVRYGAGIYVEDAREVLVRRCRARRVQNGLVLDRVDASQVYDCDFSFLSGWGIAMWRASGNLIARNALDFCVRGYSHGVYNRGQDSAGLLMFEQCSGNVVAENSITHGGDGVFGFAGREALGETEAAPELDLTRRGNNGNSFLANDLSYAAAHGLELTFSFENVIRGNRFVENAICGIWGGYSQETYVWENDFERNGGAGYGLERGGVNIEHGSRNAIVGNRFVENRCGVHLWWDPDEHLADKPWAVANGVASKRNLVVGNRFERDEVAIELRRCESTILSENEFVDVGRELLDEPPSSKRPGGKLVLAPPEATLQVLGRTRPVGARPELRGRANIVMTAWGPWDHESPLVRQVPVTRATLPGDSSVPHPAAADAWELREFPAAPRVVVAAGDVSATVLPANGSPSGPLLLVVAKREGLVPYSLTLTGENGAPPTDVHGTIANFFWRVRSFSWTRDPREDYEGWLAEAEGAVETLQTRLELNFGGEGPGAVGLAGEGDQASPPVDRFGTLAATEILLPAGRWRLQTLSDDGVRVRVDGEVLIENWTWHGPTRDETVLEISEERAVKIEVEHFELDGWAVLSLAVERAE